MNQPKPERRRIVACNLESVKSTSEMVTFEISQGNKTFIVSMYWCSAARLIDEIKTERIQRSRRQRETENEIDRRMGVTI